MIGNEEIESEHALLKAIGICLCVFTVIFFSYFIVQLTKPPSPKDKVQAMALNLDVELYKCHDDVEYTSVSTKSEDIPWEKKPIGVALIRIRNHIASIEWIDIEFPLAAILFLGFIWLTWSGINDAKKLNGG